MSIAVTEVRALCVQVKAKKNTWYRDLDFQVTSVLEKIETLQQQLSLAIQGRRWTERQGLTEQRHDLNRFFHEHVRHAVTQAFSFQQVGGVNSLSTQTGNGNSQLERKFTANVDDLSLQKDCQVSGHFSGVLLS